MNLNLFGTSLYFKHFHFFFCPARYLFISFKTTLLILEAVNVFNYFFLKDLDF